MSGDLHKHKIVESVSHTNRATTVVVVVDIDLDGESTSIPINELLMLINDALEKIPEEHRATAALNVRGYGDYVSIYADISFTRPETDKELADRRRWLKSIDDEREDRDRREFARLQRKYVAGQSR